MGIEKVCKNAYIVKSLLSPWGRKSKYAVRKWKCVSQACHRSSCSPVILRAASGLTTLRGCQRLRRECQGICVPISLQQIFQSHWYLMYYIADNNCGRTVCLIRGWNASRCIVWHLSLCRIRGILDYDKYVISYLGLRVWINSKKLQMRNLYVEHRPVGRRPNMTWCLAEDAGVCGWANVSVVGLDAFTSPICSVCGVVLWLLTFG